MNPFIVIAALALGLALGIAGAETPWGQLAARWADPVGGLWLNALKMTVVPLIVSLLITGIANTAEAARAGQLARRSVITFLVILWASSLLAVIVLSGVFTAFPLDPLAAASLKATLGATPPPPTPPGVAAFLLALVPTNPLAAAANDAILPLTVFTVLFAFATLQLPADKRARITGFFESVGDAMLVMIGWVLWLAPLGVFALAIVLGVRSGFSALNALVHYTLCLSLLGLLVTAAAYLVARFGAGISPGAFQRAILPAQAVAISTQSSLASLPAMLKASATLGVRPATADMVLPLAVALFRATGPAMNFGVALYIAHWYGIEVGPAALLAGLALGATTTLGAVSLPGQISFVASIAPIALVMGVPFEPLAILIAVETIPDIFRTLGNVSMDVAVTAMTDRHTPADPLPEPAPDARSGNPEPAVAIAHDQPE